MSQMRLYSVTTGPLAMPCDGCDVVIPPESKAVMREDRAVFCALECARMHDDAVVHARTA